MPLKKLPDAEFEIMKAVWNSDEPVTSAALTEKLRHTLPQKDWKSQTVLTMLTRLEKKGFLRSEKTGKERYYYTLISSEEYLNIEAQSFRSRFDASSLGGLVKALYNGGNLNNADIEELKQWLEEKS